MNFFKPIRKSEVTSSISGLRFAIRGKQSHSSGSGTRIPVTFQTRGSRGVPGGRAAFTACGGALRMSSARGVVTGLIVGTRDENMKREPAGVIGLCRGDRGDREDRPRRPREDFDA